MCRIVGYFNISPKSYDKNGTLSKMRDTMAFGGPDSASEYSDCLVYLGHRRLSVIGLSDAGIQPMHWKNLTLVHQKRLFVS